MFSKLRQVFFIGLVLKQLVVVFATSWNIVKATIIWGKYALVDYNFDRIKLYWWLLNSKRLLKLNIFSFYLDKLVIFIFKILNNAYL